MPTLEVLHDHFHNQDTEPTVERPWAFVDILYCTLEGFTGDLAAHLDRLVKQDGLLWYEQTIEMLTPWLVRTVPAEQVSSVTYLANGVALLQDNPTPEQVLVVLAHTPDRETVVVESMPVPRDYSEDIDRFESILLDLQSEYCE